MIHAPMTFFAEKERKGKKSGNKLAEKVLIAIFFLQNKHFLSVHILTLLDRFWRFFK